MKIIQIISSLCLIFCLSVSCEKEADYLVPSRFSNSPEGNFDAFWHGIDQNYAFFKYDPVNWDDVYDLYRPKITSATTQAELYAIIKQIFSKLIDNHREIASPFGTYIPLFDSYQGKIYNTTNLAISEYLDPAFTFGISGQKPGATESETEFIGGKIKNKSIIYLCVQFFGNALSSGNGAEQLDQFFQRYGPNSYALIIDLRNNGGGSASEFYKFCSRFINSETTWGYSQFRLQRDRYSMSPYFPETISPYGKVFYNKPIVILTNRYTISASELSTMVLNQLSNVTTLGDTTAGANGPLSDIKTYTGNFTMPNQWKIQLAQKVVLDKDKKLYEGVGIPPDMYVAQDSVKFSAGRDNLIEEAITYLSK